MTFYSLPFLLFFIVFSIALASVKSAKVQKYIYVIANIVFYAYWDYRFLILLFGVVVLCYCCACLYEKANKRRYIYFSVVICLVVLGIFKYFNFFSETFSLAFGISDHVTLDIILPLGISFYLFQAMSYLFDVMYGKVVPEKDFVKLAAYISFFVQITSGPIVKSKDFLPQLDRVHRVKKENVYEGIQLFLVGLTKKVVFADRIGVAVDAVYRAPSAYNGISVLMAVVGYSVQIYCDFSGYSDMAIGIAKIWDFDLGKNFNLPYLAKNPSDFWRRWHISLSTWFRDYVYIPLGGSRNGKWRTYFNLFITMVLSGIWHGANITFIIWGIVHGIGAVVNRAINDFMKRRNIKVSLPHGVAISLNYIFVSLAWIVFRANSLAEANSIFMSLFNLDGINYINVYAVIYIVALAIVNIFSLKRNGGDVFIINMDLDRFKNKLILATWVWLIVMFMYCGNSAFIYAQF